MSDITSLLEKLNEEKSKEKALRVRVRSLKKDFDADPISFNQQKRIIGSIAEGLASALKLQKVLNEIIRENVKCDNVLSSDRTLLALQLRNSSIGSIINIDGNEHDILNEVIGKISDIPHVKPETIKDKNIEVNVRIPTISDEDKILSRSIELMKSDGDKNVGKSVGILYTHEIIKYIESVTIGDDTVDIVKLPIKDKIVLIDALPLSLNKKISEYIQNIKKVEQDALTVEIDGEEKTIDIDVSFFDA